jgi:hypothetical protein
MRKTSKVHAEQSSTRKTKNTTPINPNHLHNFEFDNEKNVRNHKVTVGNWGFKLLI